MWWIGDSIGGAAGAIVVFLILTRGVVLDLPQLAPRARRRATTSTTTWERAAEITSPAYEHAPGHPRGPRTRPRGARPGRRRLSPPRPRPTEDGCREHLHSSLLEGASSVLVAGLVFGAGLPVVYAVALRVLTIGATSYADATGEIHSTPRLSSRLFAGLLIAVVVAGDRRRA